MQLYDLESSWQLTAASAQNDKTQPENEVNGSDIRENEYQ